jgi:hypothetical protein
VRSARHPRVAVALGVRQRWYIPLVLCRALCTSSAAGWALFTGLQLFYAVKQSEEFDVLTGRAVTRAEVYHSSYLEHYRLAACQVALSYLWVSQAGLMPSLLSRRSSSFRKPGRLLHRESRTDQKHRLAQLHILHISLPRP